MTKSSIDVTLDWYKDLRKRNQKITLTTYTDNVANKSRTIGQKA